MIPLQLLNNSMKFGKKLMVCENQSYKCFFGSLSNGFLFYFFNVNMAVRCYFWKVIIFARKKRSHFLIKTTHEASALLRCCCNSVKSAKVCNFFMMPSLYLKFILAVITCLLKEWDHDS